MTNTPIAAKLAAASRALLKKFLDVATRHDARDCDYDVCKERRDMHEALRAYDTAKGAEPPSPAMEPVAWIQYMPSGGQELRWLQQSYRSDEANLKRIPLYAAPFSWQPIETAPKDGTLVLLLIKDDGSDELNPLEDELESRTIGSYGVHGGPEEDPEWTFAGWDWDFDSFEDGRGIPIAWAPLLPLPQPPTAAPEAQEG